MRNIVFESLKDLFKKTEVEVFTARTDQMYSEGVQINVRLDDIRFDSKGSGLYDKTDSLEIEVTVHHPTDYADILESVVQVVVHRLATDPTLLKCVEEQPSISAQGFDYDDVGEVNRATCDINLSYTRLTEFDPIVDNVLDTLHFEIRPVEVSDAENPVWKETYKTLS